MDILLVAATEQEILPFLQANPTADHLITGVGVAMTTYHLTRRLHQVEYDLIIQAGIAGTFNRNIPPASVVAVERECFAGSGIMEGNNILSLFETGLWRDEFPFTGGWLVNESDQLKNLKMKMVRSATVDFITDSQELNGSVYTKYSPDIESMEGAAFHYVALLEEVPFIQVRSISNVVGERDKKNWKMDEAISALNKALDTLYAELAAHETKL